VQVLRVDPVERHVELRVIQEEAMKM
jgi:hypothetical protein